MRQTDLGVEHDGPERGDPRASRSQRTILSQERTFRVVSWTVWGRHGVSVRGAARRQTERRMRICEFVRPSIREGGDKAAKLKDGRRSRSRRQDAETGDVGRRMRMRAGKGRERSAVGRLFRLLSLWLLAALPTLLHSLASASASTASFELPYIAPSIHSHATSLTMLAPAPVYPRRSPPLL
jgi:hypothetical protein